MPPEIPRATPALLAIGLALALAGCTSAPPAPAPREAVVVVAPVPAPPPPAPAPEIVELPSPAALALAHADRVRGMPAPELAQEIARLSAVADSDADRRGGAAPLAQVQLALTLMQTRTALDALRAGGLLQRVLAQATPEARPLHPLARHLVAQLAEQKRLEEQLERQAQQLRDAQRRAELANERLDALRAIERTRPRTQ